MKNNGAHKVNFGHWFVGTMVSSAIVAFGAIGVGCSPEEVQDEVTNHYNCDVICEWAVDCEVESGTVDSCDDRCEANADASASYEEKVERCGSCIDDAHNDLACLDSRSVCAEECASIYPELTAS